VLTLTATTSGVFDPHHFKYTDASFSRDSPLWLAPGDLLIQRGNTAEYVGVPALYDGSPREFIYPDLMIRARVKPDMDPRYVWYMLLAPQARGFLRDRATGTAGNMPKINQTTLKAVPVPLPPREVRATIVERLDRAFQVADAMVKRLDNAAAELARIKEAALTKAFRGELVPTEAALAAEGGSESGEQPPAARRPPRSEEPPRRRRLDREESVAAKRSTRHG
jgi:type I restriction enzyme S subunit